LLELSLFLAIAVLLFVALLLLARRGSRPEGGAGALVEARQALTHLRTDLLPMELVGRFFAADDFEFVASAAPRAAQAMFYLERKKIALAWVHEIRQQIRILRRFHLGAARFYARMGLRSEIALATDFATLLIACRVVQALVYIGGPRVAPRLIGATVGAGQRICEAYEEALAFLTARAPAVENSIAS
jgi:hypothetical protein